MAIRQLYFFLALCEERIYTLAALLLLFSRLAPRQCTAVVAA